jgi:hypothetical protein
MTRRNGLHSLNGVTIPNTGDPVLGKDWESSSWWKVVFKPDIVVNLYESFWASFINKNTTGPEIYLIVSNGRTDNRADLDLNEKKNAQQIALDVRNSKR